ncbi:MAG TPA: NfeD family protein, partial [Candidatus Binatia bacterium]
REKLTLGIDGLIGEVGVVRDKLSPTGRIFVHGETWKAQADNEIDVGEKVEVVGVEGMVLKVRRAGQR